MASDSRLPLVIFFALVALIAIPIAIDRYQESRRPALVDLRIVTASSSDPVFRSGRRLAAPGENVEIAIALRVGRKGTPGSWIAPVDDLVIDDGPVQFLQSPGWPEKDLTVRVFWFTVESTNLGGALTVETASDRLRYRTYLAPEMGRGLEALTFPDHHYDDHIGSETTERAPFGTIRLYARVEIVKREKDVKPLHAMTSMAVDQLFDPRFPAIVRSADFPEPISGAAGELFGLPGFEPQADPEDAWNQVPLASFGRTFTELVDERIAVSSWTFAAVAVSGSPDLDRAELTPMGAVAISDDRILNKGRTLKWGQDIDAGDLLTDGRRWIVVVGDNGNGIFDTADTILHCWGRPPARTTLFAALDQEISQFEHLRYLR